MAAPIASVNAIAVEFRRAACGTLAESEDSPACSRAPAFVIVHFENFKLRQFQHFARHAAQAVKGKAAFHSRELSAFDQRGDSGAIDVFTL